MLTFTILATITAFAILLAICYIGTLGGAGILLLADVIVCIWIIWKIVHHAGKGK